jgi:hypothetical protein
MKSWTIALGALAIGAFAVANPASAGSYRIVLADPPGGKLLIGHAGVQAADDITATAKVRVVAPGNPVRERGTVRVLVMNLGATPFDFGPDDVTLTLGDGTRLEPVPVDTMEKGRVLVERERRYAGAADFRNRNNLAPLAGQSGGGATAQSAAPVPGGSTVAPSAGSATLGQDRSSDERLTPGFETIDAIYQILVPLTVAPKHAWGGYYVFDVPKAVRARRADQPLAILVRTGREEHRFAATLQWK